jgi:hypothetical protein
MTQDLIKRRNGRFFRGNLHCHSDLSDGRRSPTAVVTAYREAGYDFIALSNHFEAEYGWRVTDTRAMRGEPFTTILGAELSSGPWDEHDTYWVTAVGLPLAFEPPPRTDHAEAIQRGSDLGAFVVMLHPGLNNLPLATSGRTARNRRPPCVEIYNHNMGAGASPDQAHGAYMLDGLLEKG